MQGVTGITTGGATVGQPMWWTRQHHAFLPAPHTATTSMAQLKGSPVGGGLVGLVTIGVGGGVGRGVGGGVGRGVGGFVTISGVVGQPIFSVAQQIDCCASVHEPVSSPCWQLNGSEVDEPERSHNNKGIRSNKPSGMQIRQVKSLRGRTLEKSPPQPTYL